jgi:hypothetical protein
MATTWSADLRPLLGTAAANATVEPTSSAPAGSPNESRVWTLTWNGTIPNAISNAWTHNSTFNIPITITTEDEDTDLPIAHQEIKYITVKVDKQAPTGSTTATAIVEDGTPKPLTLSVSDATGSGVNWTTEGLTLTPNYRYDYC